MVPTSLFYAICLLLLQATGAFQLDQQSSPKPLSSPPNRRDILQWSSSFLVVSTVPQPSHAVLVGEGTERMVFRQKPTAPTGALLPAMQQRLLLEAAIEISAKGDLDKLQTVLLPLDNSVGRGDPLKQYNPARVLRGDLTRASLNLYQTNLNYNNLLANPSEAFDVTDPDWKKSYIRANDGLPDLKRVIGADLDMRQLLRNQVQLKLDDASAELYASDCDPKEVTSLLTEAAQSFDLWLDRVRAGDVQDALREAFQGEAVKVYEPYAAGFVPMPK